MNSQGQKTGGRQKGTPNKITASVKYMFKALMMNNYDLVEDSFQKAKPNERLTFIAKMTPFLCAKEQPSKNGGEWVMDQSMDHEWFQIYESDHLLRRKQRIQYEENYAAQNLNSRHQYEYELISNMVNTALKVGMDKEDLIKLVGGEFEAFYADLREDKRRLKENFRQRRENFMKIEQEFFNEEDAAEEDAAEVAKEEAEEVKEETAKAEVEEANKQSDEETQNTDIPISRCPENPHLNPSTLDSATAQSEDEPQCLNLSTLDPAAAQSEDESQCLNPSTLDSAAAHSAGKNQHLNPSTIDPKPSPQKPNIRHLRQQQRRPFYTAIANRRRR